VLEHFEKEYPSAMTSFADDLEANLTHLEAPLAHRRYMRTTNLIERSFLEEHRQNKIIPRFFNEKSNLKLVLTVLWRVSECWQRVRMSELERKATGGAQSQARPQPKPESCPHMARPNREAVHEPAYDLKPNAFYRKVRT
jgi:transposase-like protein